MTAWQAGLFPDTALTAPASLRVFHGAINNCALEFGVFKTAPQLILDPLQGVLRQIFLVKAKVTSCDLPVHHMVHNVLLVSVHVLSCCLAQSLHEVARDKVITAAELLDEQLRDNVRPLVQADIDQRGQASLTHGDRSVPEHPVSVELHQILSQVVKLVEPNSSQLLEVLLHVHRLGEGKSREQIIQKTIVAP